MRNSFNEGNTTLKFLSYQLGPITKIASYLDLMKRNITWGLRQESLSEVLMFDLTICYINLVTTYSHSVHQSMYPSMYLPIYLSSFQKEKSKMQMKSNNFPVRLLYMKVKKRGKSGGNELNLPKNSLYRTWLISVIKLAWVVSKNLSSLCCALY
jgi:hypothetical protein